MSKPAVSAACTSTPQWNDGIQATVRAGRFKPRQAQCKAARPEANRPAYERSVSRNGAAVAQKLRQRGCRQIVIKSDDTLAGVNSLKLRSEAGNCLASAVMTSLRSIRWFPQKWIQTFQGIDGRLFAHQIRVPL